jgi:hypothetical protein
MNLQLQNTSLNQRELPKNLTSGIFSWQKTVNNLPQSGISRAAAALPAYSRPTTERISTRLAAAIRASRYILDLEDDWDEEGSGNKFCKTNCFVLSPICWNLD